MIEISNSTLLGIDKKSDPILIIGEDADFETCVQSVLALTTLSDNMFTFSAPIWDLIKIE